jgi:acetyl-CoA carboxylase biotin carboxyl carrier protein
MSLPIFMLSKRNYSNSPPTLRPSKNRQCEKEVALTRRNDIILISIRLQELKRDAFAYERGWFETHHPNEERDMGLMEVRAEITGTVTEILLIAGDQFAAGDEIMILDAMKMEVPVVTVYSGRVVTMHVGAGESVTEDQLLATVETSD